MKRNLTLIIVDDEQSAIDHALSIIEPFIDLIAVATFTNPVEALKYLQKNHVDFALLDVEMPLVDGLAFALQMPSEIKTIFSTAYREYAVDAFNRDAVDYLMKPIQSERFAKAITRMKNALTIQANAQAPIKDDYYYFMIKGPIKYHRTRINFDEIVYIESRGDRTHFFLISDLKKEDRRRLALQLKRQKDIEAGKTEIKKTGNPGYEGVSCLLTLQQVHEIVTGSTLMQIYKSIILNTTYFRKYGAGTVGLVGLETITLPTGGRKNYPEFFEFIENHHTPTD